MAADQRADLDGLALLLWFKGTLRTRALQRSMANLFQCT